MSYEVGNGSKVQFRYDVWCGEQSLMFSFLKLFTIACCRDAWVAGHM